VRFLPLIISWLIIGTPIDGPDRPYSPFTNADRLEHSAAATLTLDDPDVTSQPTCKKA
jgi:hypothetical protein